MIQRESFSFIPGLKRFAERRSPQNANAELIFKVLTGQEFRTVGIFPIRTVGPFVENQYPFRIYYSRISGKITPLPKESLPQEYTDNMFGCLEVIITRANVVTYPETRQVDLSADPRYTIQVVEKYDVAYDKKGKPQLYPAPKRDGVDTKILSDIDAFNAKYGIKESEAA